MSLHNFVGVKSILNGVPRFAFRQQRGSGYTLGAGKLQHHLRLDKLVLDCPAGHEQTGCDSRAVLPDPFQHS